MFRSAIHAVMCLIVFSACNNEAKTNNSPAPAEENVIVEPVDTIPKDMVDTIPIDMPGSDRDEKGCITSAGYQWSVIKNSCIRIFEEGIKLLPKDPSLDQTTAAFIVFSQDRVRVEIFLPSQKKAVIIRRTEGSGEPTEWKSGPLTLSLKENEYILEDEGKVLYRGK